MASIDITTDARPSSYASGMSAHRWLVYVAMALLPGIAGAVAVQDDDRNTIELPGPANRIVSLAPGATAMLFAAGAGDRVVGTSAYSDEPAAARRIERIGDAQSFDLERILALRPDVVVVWTGGTSLAEVARLESVGLRIYHHHVTRLDDFPDSLRRLGVLAGTDAQANSAAAQLAQRIAALRSHYPQRRDASVFVQLWDRPLYTVGRDQIITDVIHACGFRSAYEDLNDASPAVTIESVLARNPDIILALTSDRHAAQSWLAQWREFNSMKAQRNAHVIAWSDERLTRIGPSVVDAAEVLCKALPAVESPGP
jgi:iron complex transport system substrate-binding protein